MPFGTIGLLYEITYIMHVAVDSNLLITWGASSKMYDKGECIFREGESPRYYFQVEQGEVEMYNTNTEGRSFVQGIFHDGDSFGEPPLFIEEKYPATAVATKHTVVLRLPKERFFKVLEEYRAIEREFLRILARRTFRKSMLARGLVNCGPEERLLTMLDEIKKELPESSGRQLIPYTRQQLANLCGLRVETVIRTLSDMNRRNLVQIQDRKLYY